MLHHWASIVACKVCHLSFVTWWTWYVSFLLVRAWYSDFFWSSQMWSIPFIPWIPLVYAFLLNVIFICIKPRHVSDNNWIKSPIIQLHGDRRPIPAGMHVNAWRFLCGWFELVNWNTSHATCSCSSPTFQVCEEHFLFGKFKPHCLGNTAKIKTQECLLSSISSFTLFQFPFQGSMLRVCLAWGSSLSQRWRGKSLSTPHRMLIKWTLKVWIAFSAKFCWWSCGGTSW